MTEPVTSPGWLDWCGEPVYHDDNGGFLPGMRQLLIFLKYPTPGQVKTRLAASVGEDAASHISRLCTELILERLASFRRDAVLCVHPPEALERTQAWLGSEWSLRPQQGDTLGERLMEAMGHAFAQGARRVVAIGSDSPWLEPHDIETAFDVLERVPVTIGPTEDGGYYLMGLSQPVPYLFEGIPWSTTSVYTETLAHASLLGLSVQSLPLGYDLDRVDDVQRFVASERARGTPAGALNTIVQHMALTVDHQRSSACRSASISVSGGGTHA